MIKFRPSNQPSIRNQATLPVEGGASPLVTTFNNLADRREHVALVFGDIRNQPVPLVRIHSECLTGDVFGSQRCDCGAQKQEAIDRFSREGGILLYMRQEGRDHGLYAKIDEYAVQDKFKVDTFEASRILRLREDDRNYADAARMLRALGVTRVRLLTNNPDKHEDLVKNGIAVDQVIPTGIHLTPHNAAYLAAKQAQAGHNLKMGMQ